MNNHLREAHAHLFSHGRSLAMPSLAACQGADDCLAIARDAARRERARADPGWALLVGARLESWTSPGAGPSGWPTLRQLDEATGPVPCIAMSFDHHMVMANSAALWAAGFASGKQAPPGGVIDRDDGGNPTGMLLETAAWVAWNAAPDPTPDQRRDLVRHALRDLASLGYAQVHDMHSQPWLGQLLSELSDAGELPVSVWLYPAVDHLKEIAQAAAHWSRPAIRLAGGKIFVDGTLNSRTAWMLHPFEHPQPGLESGKIVTPPAAIESALRTCSEAGVGLAAHAIGDGAVRACLNALEKLRTIGALPARRAEFPQLRIEHAEIIDAQDVPRFARLGAVASVQPCHLLADIEALRRYLPHRLDRVLPLRELIDAGCTPGELLWFGSDVPIVRADPADSIQAAVHRRRPGSHDTEAIAPTQAISEQEAWACFSPRER